MYLHSLTLLLAAAFLSPTDDWATWRGPTGDGVSTSKTAPLTWNTETNVKWKIPLEHPANGSPIVVGDRIFLTTPEDTDGKKRSLQCFRRADGEMIWTRTVEIDKKMETHRSNPYCGTTPASDGERVVVWHASAGLHCYDMKGEELWKRDLGTFSHIWGYGSSPVIHGGHVLLNTGPGERTFVTAIDVKTGKTIWETDEPDLRTAEEIEAKRIIGSWCTPVVVPSGDVDVLLCAQPTRIVAYDLSSGSIIWTCAGNSGTRGDLTYSSPVIADDLCVFVGGWEGPTMGVRLGGKGDVTESHRAWRHAGQMSNCASGVYKNGRVFVPDMQGKLWCIDPATGEADWKKRIASGATWGSIVLVGDQMYLMSQKGTTVVFTADAEGLEILAENELGETTNSTPAIVDGEVFLRTHESLYCIAEED